MSSTKHLRLPFVLVHGDHNRQPPLLLSGGHSKQKPVVLLAGGHPQTKTSPIFHPWSRAVRGSLEKDRPSCPPSTTGVPSALPVAFPAASSSTGQVWTPDSGHHLNFTQNR